MEKQQKKSTLLFLVLLAVVSALILYVTYTVITDAPNTFPQEIKNPLPEQPTTLIDNDGYTLVEWTVPSHYTQHEIQYRSIETGLISGIREETVESDAESATVRIKLQHPALSEDTDGNMYEYQVRSYSPTTDTNLLSELRPISLNKL